MLWTFIKWIAAIYAIGYILFGYPIDSLLMRTVHGVLLMIFAVQVVVFLNKKRELF